jgi:lactoylglutathione lyase
MIQRLFETHLNISDLERSMQFYGEVLELPFAHKIEERRVAFYWIGGRNQAMLGLWEKPPEQIQRQHFAFQITIRDMRHAWDHLEAQGLEVRNFNDDGTRRPLVFGWMPAVAIYFTDPDGHSLEYIAPLPGKARPELGVIPWEDWEKNSSQ